MSARSHNIMMSSPPSSEGATFHDTPSTIVTTYSGSGSNDGSKSKLKLKPTLVLPTSTRKTVHGNVNHIADPFLHAPATIDSGLSPLASEFTPKVEDGKAPTPRASNYRPVVIGPHPTHMDVSAAGVSVRKVEASQVKSTTTAASLMPIAPPSAVAGPQASALPFDGVFTTDDGLSRSFAIENVGPQWGYQTFVQMCRPYKTLLKLDCTKLQTHGRMVATFGDVFEAKQAFALVKAVNPGWTVTFVTAKDAAAHAGQDIRRLSDYQGQVVATVYYDDVASRTPPGAVLAHLEKILKRFGELKAIVELPTCQPRIFDFRVEFKDCRAADLALNSGDNWSEHALVKIEPYNPDVPPLPPVQVSPPAYTQERPSATGRSIVPAGMPGYDSLVNQLRSGNQGGRRERSPPRNSFTRIDIYRIRAGLDVRTTVMLRNIPNRLELHQLKEMLDETSAGHYDFMYLRIDFANNCNVGYAFINFIDPAYIIRFAQERQGRRWNSCNSDKVAEISYATVQGRENLIQKFRNSAIMLEHPDFRPKLFYAGNHPHSGQEEPFPSPDNYQKMRRSMENAETVGLYRPTLLDTPPPSPDMHLGYFHCFKCALAVWARNNNVTLTRAKKMAADAYFASRACIPSPATTTEGSSSSSSPGINNFPSRLFAPRQGQAYREEQRRRRSQYDRGTPGAEAELMSFRELGIRDSPGFDYPPSGPVASGTYPYNNKW